MTLTVNQAVWVAAAAMTYERMQRSNVTTLNEIALVQADIRKRAQQLITDIVHSPMISQHFNGDHPEKIHNYLRQINGDKRRVSYSGEFNGVKENPGFTLEQQQGVIDLTNGDQITIKQLIDFIGNEYRTLVEKLQSDNAIDFHKIIAHLQKYANAPYKNPVSVDGTEKDRYLAIRESGSAAVTEVNKLADYFSQKYGLKNKGKSKWLTGGNDVVRRYLWNQLKDEAYEDVLTSVSFFVENEGEDIQFRISVELDEKYAKQDDYDQHHKLLQKPRIENASYCYYVKTSSAWESEISYESTQEVYDKVQNGVYKKVQLSYILTLTEITDQQLTNPQIFNKLDEAFANLLDYYHLVLGKETINPEEGEELAMYDKNIVLYGPPGTGKTYHTVLYAVAIIENTPLEKLLLEQYENVLQRFNRYKESEQIAFTTFHQSFGYEEFIEGIKPIFNDESDQVKYKIEPGLFKQLCDNAQDSSNDEEKKNYVFIIDEINRGNISKILGELITLIEPTKRIDAPEEMKVRLPYSKTEFGVPQNVYIIGTMNTADRSIALMDTALRRRFRFIEMMPNEQVLAGIYVEGIDIQKMVSTINKRIEVLYDREHTIGHAYFLGLKKDPTLSNLARVFENAIIPLLQEYFYEDYSKIQLILGDNAKANDLKFILDLPVQMNAIFKANPDVDLPESKYAIQRAAFLNPQSYIEIYE